MNFKAIFISVFMLATHLWSSAQSIHLIVVGDTYDVSIGSGVKGNVANVRSWFSSAAKTLGMQFQENLIIDSSFGCSAFQDSLTKDTVSPEDTVVFYYSGHGYRLQADPSEFPSFFCGQEVYTGSAPSLIQTAAKLSASGARLVIAIADTCNVLIAQPQLPLPAFQFDRIEVPRAEAYRNLLVRHRGSLIVSSSSPGEYSWYYPNNGLFTAQLIRSLDKNTLPGASGAWEKVLSDALIRIKVPTGSTENPVMIEQNPKADRTNLSMVP